MPRHVFTTFCLSFLILAGCHPASRSEPVATLEGQVTVNGKPLPEDAVGSVIFMPRAKGQARAAEAKIQGGHYRAEEAPLGEDTALFHISRSTGKMVKDSPRDEHPHPELIDLVPVKQRSGVPVNVTGDNPHQDFDLRD